MWKSITATRFSLSFCVGQAVPPAMHVETRLEAHVRNTKE